MKACIWTLWKIRNTCRLALHSLENLNGWPEWIRLELRQYRADGELLDAIGLDLLADQTYAGGHTGRPIHSPRTARPHCLAAPTSSPPSCRPCLHSARNALQLHIGQGPRLKQAIGDAPVDRPTLRDVFKERPAQQSPAHPNVMRLRGGMDG